MKITCSKCGEFLDLERIGKYRYCRDCHKVLMKEYRRKLKENIDNMLKEEKEIMFAGVKIKITIEAKTEQRYSPLTLLSLLNLPEDIEIWKPINGFEGLYEVSNWGRVKSLRRQIFREGNFMGVESVIAKERILKPLYSTNRYYTVKLHKNTVQKNCMIHKLVANEFLSPDATREFVNHKDGNRYNNRLENLERCTRSENQIHAFATGLNVPRKGKDHLSARKVGRFSGGILIKSYPFITAAEEDGYGRHYVSKCARYGGLYKGFEWSFLI